MRKIENSEAFAPKLKGSGKLEYCLWSITGENDNDLYVQIVCNHVDTKVPGSHSNLLFRVSDYRGENNAFGNMRGLNPDGFMEEHCSSNNNAGFLKAILRHLPP